MALVTIRRSPSVQTPRKTDEAERSSETEEDAGSRVSRSLNECYFANKGAALVLGGAEAAGCDRRRSPARAQPQPDIQHHLQAMFYLLRPEETLKMAVKLESAHPGRTRYLVVVCRSDEAALLGIDCNERTSVGLVLRVLADTSINLDGDGGFSVRVCNQQHIFKPVSVQAMWSALQTLHRAGERARHLNHFAGGTSHAWAGYYEARVDSDRSCLNEWHAMDCLESRRPPSPDSLRLKPRQRDETERVIRSTLKEIMMSVDLDEVTSKVIRGRLESDLDMDLAEYKSFIDQEMLTILGQMDAPTEIFEHVYLGSEWNASNLEELQRNGVRHILNVTREIDNFFPGMFDYLNVRVYDDDQTDLLKHWDNTFKYINKARHEGSKVLVHCKMGISRSASVVIAYAMKAYNWNFSRALRHVRTKRGCIKPNGNFLGQLETYQGILDAMKNKEKLQRSKSETNLESRAGAARAARQLARPAGAARRAIGVAGATSSAARPRSWSPDSSLAARAAPPTSVSLENLALACETRHMLMPCAGGSYSVSPNQIIRLKEEGAPSVRHIVHEIENAAADRRAFSRRLHRRLASRDRAAAAAAAAAAGASTWEHSRPEDCDDVVQSDSGTIDSKATIVDAFCNLIERSAESDYMKCSDGSVAGAPALEPARQGSGAAGRRVPAPADISDNERKFNETCAILQELAAAAARMAGARTGGASTWGGRLAVSAPADPARRPRARRRRLLAASQPDLSAATAAGPRGLVSNLKKEFEALSGEPAGADESPRRAGKSRSLPADRPVAPTVPAVPAMPAEDVSVRVLVDRYDKPSKAEAAGEPSKARSPLELDPKKCRLSSDSEGRARGAAPLLRNSFCGAAPCLRNSFCGVLRGAGPTERPPVAPHVVSMSYPAAAAPTVMSKAQNKKQLQHGKTHPLTRLNMNRSNNRCSNPVYNTM